MKKVSTISLVCAIVLIVAAIVLNVIGFSCINGVHYARHMGYGYMQMAFYSNSSMTATCLAMIIAGGFLFIGGILLLMLSVNTRCRAHRFLFHKMMEERRAAEGEHCCCKAPEETEEQNQ